MRTIWKFEIPVADVAKIRMPAGAQILTVKDPQGWGPILLWAEVDTEAEIVSRIFYVVGTGNPIEFQDGRPFAYIGSVSQARGCARSGTFSMERRSRWHIAPDCAIVPHVEQRRVPMSTNTVFTPIATTKVTYEITTWRGRFIGLTDDAEYAQSAAAQGYLVREV